MIAELKNLHGLGRVRCRGTPAFHVQLLLGCAAINLKRLAARPPTAHQGIAAAPKVATGAAAQRPDPRQQQQPILGSRRQLIWTVSLCLN